MNSCARRIRLLGVFVLISLLCAVSRSGAVSRERGFAIIVNKANPATLLKRTQIVPIYRGKVSRWPFGAEIVAVDLPEKSPVHASFLRNLLKTTEEEWKAYWIDQKLTHNIDPPRRAADAVAARRIVAAKAGAIGYIPVEAVDDSIKVVGVE